MTEHTSQIQGKPVTLGREFLLELPQIQLASGEQFAHENIVTWATTPLGYSPKLLSDYPLKLSVWTTPKATLWSNPQVNSKAKPWTKPWAKHWAKHWAKPWTKYWPKTRAKPWADPGLNPS